MTQKSSEYTGPLRFDSGHELAGLRWFGLGDDGMLRVTDDSVGPIVDVHTHLALAYLRKMPLDLMARTGAVRHYLPLDDPWDLDVYANRNFTPDSMAAMKRDLGIDGLTAGGRLRTTHTGPNLLAEMDALGIEQSLLLPVDLPYISWNAEAYLDVARQEPRLASLGSVHPHVRNAAEKLVAQKAAGAIGVKVHPAVQMVSPDHPKAMALYRVCAELELPVLWHCGPVGIETAKGRKLSQVKNYWQAVHDNPDTRFVLGHSGALQMELGLELCKRYENVYLEVSSQQLTNVRRIVAEAPAERVLFGSDWPFYHQVLPLAKVLIAMPEATTERRLLLYDNAVRLFGLA